MQRDICNAVTDGIMRCMDAAVQQPELAEMMGQMCGRTELLAEASYSIHMDEMRRINKRIYSDAQR